MSNRRPLDDQPSTTTRRHFTLPERLDAEVQQLAAHHSQENVSRFIRNAIEDYKGTLDGEGRVALKRLEQETSHLHELLSELNGDVADIAERIEERNNGGTHDVPSSVTSEGFDDAKQVLGELHAATTPLRGEDLTERLELSPRRVTHALEQLIDIGSIVESPHSERYQPITMQPTTDTNTNQYNE
jgi:predicted nuclease with TOPRIM domain